ncbi:MAG: hypothetical protein IMY86_12350 [Chloroflexi bacterium]|jgi:hypothetical protein|nr:hypothetical protein [Chloroflexota bacterium]
MGEEQVKEPRASYAATAGGAADILQRYPLPVSADRLRDSASNVEQQIAAYSSIVRRFEERYGGTLETFEHQIVQGDVPEHPAWEEALEWGVALDEIERLRIIQKALQWILNFSQ